MKLASSAYLIKMPYTSLNIGNLALSVATLLNKTYFITSPNSYCYLFSEDNTCISQTLIKCYQLS